MALTWPPDPPRLPASPPRSPSQQHPEVWHEVSPVPQVTVLFADMKGSMDLLPDREPDEARRIPQ